MKQKTTRVKFTHLKGLQRANVYVMMAQQGYGSKPPEYVEVYENGSIAKLPIKTGKGYNL